MVGSSGAKRPLEPWECGDRILGTAKLGVEEACAGDSVYEFVGMIWNICSEEKIRVDQLRGRIRKSSAPILNVFNYGQFSCLHDTGSL